jgi:transposase
MIEALIHGERDPKVLAELARGRMRTKVGDLTLALAGRFVDHHALLAQMHLDHIDHLSAMIERLDGRIEAVIAPFGKQLQLLCTIPGIGPHAAQVIIGEIGVDTSRFPTPAHLASWAGLCPGNHESAGKHRSGRARKGNQEIREILTECAWSAGRTSTYVGARFRRLHRRFGKTGGKKAAFATAHTLIEIIWHVLTDGMEYRDLGADYFTRRLDTPDAAKMRLIRQLKELGYEVTVQPAA